MSNSTNNASNAYLVVAFTNTIRFWLHLVPNVLSILCSIFLLYHFLSHRNLRLALNNHIIILLLLLGLFYELTDINWIILYYHYGYTFIQTPAFALVWTFIDYSVFNCQLMLFAWATIERHILVFHDRWLATRKKRFVVHYLPMIMITTYFILYYSIIFFVPFCENSFDFSKIYGMTSLHCIYKNPIIPKFGIIFEGVLPTLTIIIFSLGLLLRVLLQQSRLRRSINWRRQRKLIVQLSSISIIYLILYAPYILLYLAYNVGLSRDVGKVLTVYFIFFSYYITFLFPFVCCFTMPQIGVKIKTLLFCL